MPRLASHCLQTNKNKNFYAPSTAKIQAMHFGSSQQACLQIAGSHDRLPRVGWRAPPCPSSVSCFHWADGLHGGRQAGIWAHLHED